MISVSVIIPVYNRIDFCRVALDILRTQTLRDIEFLIYDDGSTDGSYEYLVESTHGDSRFRIFRSDKNMGPSAMRNMAIHQANGEYIGFFDIDDAVACDYWSMMYDVAVRDNSDIVFCAHNDFHHNNVGMVVSLADKINSMPNGAAWDKIYRRTMILDNNIEFPVGLYTADNVFCLKSMYFAKSVSLVNSPVYRYTLAPDSISSDSAKTAKRKRDIFSVVSLMTEFAHQQQFDNRSMCELYYFINRTVGGYFDDKKFQKQWSDAMRIFATMHAHQVKIQNKGRFSMRVFIVKVGRLFGLIPRHKYNRKLLRARIKSSGLFDSRYYLQANPDVRAAGVDAISHYLEHGWREGRDPSPLFSTRGYILDYPDVAAADICPLLHYIHHGRREGRKIRGNGAVYYKNTLGNISQYPIRVRSEYEYLKSIIKSEKK